MLLFSLVCFSFPVDIGTAGTAVVVAVVCVLTVVNRSFGSLFGW